MNTTQLFIGIMSGTSLDGVDIALCGIDESKCELLAYREYPYDTTVRQEVLDAMTHPITVGAFGALHRKLGEMFCTLTQQFLAENKIQKEKVVALGLHGQTLWHEPKSAHPFSVQLGDGNVLAQKLGITTVTDFRNGDMVLGGEGAPFAPVFHQFYYGRGNKAVVNIGGMANITLLDGKLRGWDVGCGNILLDSWMQHTQNKGYDKDGAFARDGVVDCKLLDELTDDPYFLKTPPKSTGREYFNLDWLQHYLKHHKKLSDADVMATLVELVASTIARDAKGVDEIIVCGGGAKNLFLVERLAHLSGAKITQEIHSDALEAMAFAWLAAQRIAGKKVSLSSVTGALKDTLLGAIYG